MKTKAFTLLPTVVALVLVASIGLVYGGITQRWGMSRDTRQAAQRLAGLPERIGQWRAAEDEPLSDRECRVLRLQGHVKRTYQNVRTGKQVELYLVLGPTGPISVHQPEICFRNHAYDQRGQRSEVAIGNDAVWQLTFDPSESNLDGQLVRVYYGWSDGGAWQAPADARLAFVGKSHLYKLQLTAQLPPTTDLSRDDPCKEFLYDFLPVASAYLEDADSLISWD